VTCLSNGLEWLTMDQSGFQKRFYAVVGSGACVLLVLVWVLIKGGLSPRGFAVAALVWWIAMFATLFPLIRSRQRSAEREALDRDRCVRNIRSMKRLIVLFAIFLGYGVLTTQGEPMLPRAVGAAVDVCFLAACVHSLIRSRKRLKALSADRATESSDTN
jgi:hypothetical protein